MQPKRALLNAADYLAREFLERERHEYVNGQVYALSGASRRHGQVIANLATPAHIAARKLAGCQVFSQGVKVHVAARNSYYYPDVGASCEPGDSDEYIVREPCFLIEVLSPATASIDRREKRLAYMTLDSLTEYVMVEQERMRVDFYQRDGGTWNLYILRQPDEVVELSCLALRLTLEQIYDGVDLSLRVSEPEPPEYLTA